MRKFKRRQRHSLPFGLFLAVAGALLLPAALAPRANAGSTGYWDFEDPLGSRPRPAPELFSQPQGVLINQPLASNYNPTLALNVASAEQPSMFQPLVPDANAPGPAASARWSTAGNWTAGVRQPAPRSPPSTPIHHQPNLTAATAVGELHMATGVTQNVTISASVANILTINGVGGTGVLIDNASAFTLTITARVAIGTTQTWTNNSSNLFTVSGATVALGGNDVLTVNGTGNTLISAVITGRYGFSPYEGRHRHVNSYRE